MNDPYRVAVWCSTGKYKTPEKSTDVGQLKIQEDLPQHSTFVYMDNTISSPSKHRINIDLIAEKHTRESLMNHSIDLHSFDAVVMENCPVNVPVNYVNIQMGDILTHNLGMMLKNGGLVFVRVLIDTSKDINLDKKIYSASNKEVRYMVNGGVFVPSLNIHTQIPFTENNAEDVVFMYEKPSKNRLYSIYRYEIDKFQRIGGGKPLETMTLNELKALCKSHHIRHSGLTKSALIANLRKL